MNHFFASRKNFFKICAETTRLGSGQKTSDFGKISYAYKKFKINRDLQKSGPSLLLILYRRQIIIVPVASVKLYFNERMFLLSKWLLRSVEEKEADPWTKTISLRQAH